MFVSTSMLVFCLPHSLGSPSLYNTSRRQGWDWGLPILSLFLHFWQTRTLSTITLDTHPLPFDFTDQLFQYENWPSADNLLIEATQTAPETNDLYLSLWCPDEAAHLSLTIVSLSAISTQVTPSLFMVPLSLPPITIPK